MASALHGELLSHEKAGVRLEKASSREAAALIVELRGTEPASSDRERITDYLLNVPRLAAELIRTLMPRP